MDVRAENRGRPHQKVRFPAAPVVGETFWPLGIRAQGSGMSAENPDQKVYDYAVFSSLISRKKGPKRVCEQSTRATRKWLGKKIP